MLSSVPCAPRPRPLLCFLLLVSCLLPLGCGPSVSTSASEPSPASPASGMTASKQGLFRASFTSAVVPLPLNQVHNWQLHLERPDGRPVKSARIAVDGGMPAHGHGLPTQPQVTKDLGNGDYLVEGMKFSMPGAWMVNLHITADGQSDQVTFDFSIP